MIVLLFPVIILHSEIWKKPGIGTSYEEQVVIYGHGKIILPCPHFASECFLYDEKGVLVEHFKDKKTENGFTYEIGESIKCIREGKLESTVVPWEDTIACSKLFDQIDATRQ